MTQKIEEQMRTQMSGIPNVDKMDIYDMLEFMGASRRECADRTDGSADGFHAGFNYCPGSSRGT
ncbi:MAG: hypothetical protein ACLR08_12495 [Dorea longicatena]